MYRIMLCIVYNYRDSQGLKFCIKYTSYWVLESCKSEKFDWRWLDTEKYFSLGSLKKCSEMEFCVQEFN